MVEHTQNTPSPLARASYEIHSPRLVIRTPTMEDAEACYKLLTSPENFPFGQPKEAAALQPEDLAAHMGTVADNVAAGKNAIVILVLKETGELVGHGAYNAVEAVARLAFLGEAENAENLHDNEAGAAAVGVDKPTYMADVGLLIAYAHRHRGYALEAMSALIEYARTDMSCELFRVETEPANEPWRALMRTAGLEAVESAAKASFDSNKGVVAWKFDTAHWDAAKKTMRLQGKWYL